MSAEPAVGLDAVRALRHARQRHRMGNLDWFEVAYRVYLFGIFGGGTVLWISSSIHDHDVSAGALADIARHGPPWLGLLAAVAVLTGLRGGAQGGPLALEAADAAHVMTAPVPRRGALMRPAVQRIRVALFAGAGCGAIAGQLAGRRLPGSVMAWTGSGALYGATVAGLWIAGALVAHVARLPRWLATVAGLVLVTWQALSAAGTVPGPADTVGSLALWGWRQHTVDLAGVAVVAVGIAVGLAGLARISLEALARRSSLVAQLRFAVTMQDLRTVMLLRRQLNQERPRPRPWVRIGTTTRGGLTTTVLRRGLHGLARTPLTRLVRMAALAAGMGALQGAAARGTTPAFAGAALLGFVLGLDALEPLSQEIDQPDRADSLPVDRGSVLVRHLGAPAMLLVPYAAIAGAAAIAVAGSGATGAALILSVPVTLATACGSVVSIIRDAPDPLGGTTQQAFVPPEIAGFTNTIRMVWPLVVSTLGAATALFARVAHDQGAGPIAGAIRGAAGALIMVAFVAYWVKVRDHIRRRIRAFLDEGRAQTSAQRMATRTGGAA